MIVFIFQDTSPTLVYGQASHIKTSHTSVEMISLVVQLSGLNHHPTNWVYFTKFMPHFNRVANELVNVFLENVCTKSRMPV